MDRTASDAAASAPRSVVRLREVVVGLLLVALAFAQDSGRIVSDTKLDLVVDPAAFLARSLSVWDPLAGMGQVQNQAYGYLWPMGPFFLLGHDLSLPAWVVQRLWWSLLLLVGYTGMLALLRRWGTGTPTWRIVGAVAFVLAPRVLSTMGTISVESWPVALAPWLLVPLVAGSRGGSARRAALGSALVAACLGGVNATASLAVLVLPLVYLLTRVRGPRRTRLLGWWVLGVVLATAWWVGPLLVLSRNAFPFLDLIETASVATAPASMLNVLRGTDHWIGFVVVDGSPWWRAGWWLSTAGVAVVATAAAAALGLTGLARRGVPEGRFLRLVLALGVVGLAIGYGGALSAPWADAVQQLLDGPLAPLRNVHKLDPLVRLPLAVGLASAGPLLVPRVQGLLRRGFPDARARGRAAVAVVAATMVLVLGAAWSPLARSEVPARGSFEAVPAAWQDLAAWLDARDAAGRTLVLPSSNFAEYDWGRPLDEPLQSLSSAPWVVRNAVPLGAPGSARWLDAVQAVTATGTGSAALAPALRAAGIRWIVLRHDLDPATDVVPASVVGAALRSSPGLAEVAQFGDLAADPLAQTAGTDGFVPAPTLEVFAVPGDVAPAEVVPSSSLTVRSAGPEAAVTGLAPSDPSWVALADAQGATATSVTDTPRRRALDVGAQRGSDYSPTLASGVTTWSGHRVVDVTPWPGSLLDAVSSLSGAEAVEASSTAADPFAPGYRGPAARPASAIDGDPSTSWLSSWGDEAPSWIVAFPSTELDSVRITLADASKVASVSVETAAGRSDGLVPSEEPLSVRLPRGTTTWLRIDLVPRAGVQSVGLAEVAAPGLTVTEHVRTASVPAGGLAVARAVGERRACVDLGDHWACSDRLRRKSEDAAGLDRLVTGPVSGLLTVTVRPVQGPALDALLDGAAGLRVSASSAAFDDAAARAGAALDGSPTTAWVPARDDALPTLEVRTDRPVSLDRLRLGPLTVGVTGAVVGDGVRRTEADLVDGVLRFPATTSSRWTIAFRTSSPAGPSSTRRIDLAAGSFGPATGTVTLPCGRGPSVLVGGTRVELAVSATADELLASTPVAARPCGSPTVSIPAGEQHLAAADTAAIGVDTVRIGASSAPVVPLPSQITTWGAEDRALEVGPGPDAVLVVHEGFAAGWTASVDGVPLATVRIAGWQQGFRLPAAAAGRTVQLHYGPGDVHRTLLGAGAVALLCLIALAVLPVRSRRPEPEPAPPAGPLRGEGTAVLVLTTGLVAGLVGLVVAACALLASRRAPRAVRPAVAGLLLLASAAVAAIAGTTTGSSAGSAVVQLLALGALAVALVGGLRRPVP
ncbi:MAG: alpha-(1-_3)-arabinofuranosyltransferase family protein [Candidatus Nanopelagicales bacterium]